MKLKYTPEQVQFFAKCGRKGGISTSVKKIRAARRNGKKHVSTVVTSAMKSNDS